MIGNTERKKADLMSENQAKRMFNVLCGYKDFKYVKSANTVLLFALGHTYYYDALVRKFPNKNIIMLDDCSLSFLGTNGKIHYYNIYSVKEIKKALDKICKEQNIVKLDCIIMNPPYEGTLHLDIQREVLKHLSKKGKIVNLSPFRWILDPLSSIKKGTTLDKYTDVAEAIYEEPFIFDNMEITSLFGGEENVKINTQVAISVLSLEKGDFDYKEFIKRKNPLVERIIPYLASSQGIKFTEYDENIHSIFLPIRKITNPKRNTYLNLWTQTQIIHNGMSSIGVEWKKTLYKSKRLSDNRTLSGLPFNSMEEVNNCFNSLKLMTYKYLLKSILSDVNFSNHTFIWLGNTINPRTGLVGYLSDWTDEDLIKIFGISEEEQLYMKEIMTPYM